MPLYGSEEFGNIFGQNKSSPSLADSYLNSTPTPPMSPEAKKETVEDKWYGY